MLDMFGMLGKAKEMQARIQEIKENVVKIEALGEAGGGMVKATVNGKHHIVRIEVEEGLLKPEDKHILENLVLAAVNKAMIEVDILIKEEFRKKTEGVLPNIPGLDLGNLFH